MAAAVTMRGNRTRDRLVEVGGDLVYRHGYEATGVARICDAAGVQKGSFYYFWPSKRDLVIASLAPAWQEHLRRVLQPAFAMSSLPAALDEWGHRLVGVHRHYQDEPDGRVRGCRFGNLAAECSSGDPVLRDAVGQHLQLMVSFVADRLRLFDDVTGTPGQDPAVAAAGLVAHMEGLAILAKVSDDPTVLGRLGRDSRLLLGITPDL